MNPTRIRRHRSGHPSRVAALAACLPVLFLLPLALGHPYGPVLHLGGPGSASYLDLWAVLTFLASAVGAVPGLVAGYKLRGPLGAVGMLAWLVGLCVFAYERGRWIS